MPRIEKGSGTVYPENDVFAVLDEPRAGQRAVQALTVRKWATRGSASSSRTLSTRSK
jgi:hypothetical protein